MRWLRSIRVQLTLWYCFLVAAAVGVFAFIGYTSVQASLEDRIDEELRTDAAIARGLVDTAPSALPAALAATPLADSDVLVRLYDDAGQLVASSGPLSAVAAMPDAPVHRALQGAETMTTVDAGTTRVRLLTIQAPGGRVVQVGLDTADADRELAAFRGVIAVSVPFTLLIAGLGGFLLAHRALMPVGRITATAAEITEQDLSRRLNLRLPPDELGRLADTLDAMINRLDRAFARQRQFTADASHELRTPLTAIRGQAEVALRQDRTRADYRRVLTAIDQEAQHMGGIVENLLLLARSDAGQLDLLVQPVELVALASEVAAQFAAASAAREQTLSVVGAAPVDVQADRERLRQLLTNLIDNAVRYAGRGAAVTVTIAPQDAIVRIVVSDTGGGIPPDHLPHVFERFYRVDRARSRAEGGAGLGLAIVREVATAHGGSVAVTSQPGHGTAFTVTLPRRSDRMLPAAP